MTRLHITIGPRLTLVERVVTLTMATASFLAVPVVNEVFLGGHWAVHLVGGLFGVLILLALARSASDRVQSFRTKEEAAEWVLSGKWEQNQ